MEFKNTHICAFFLTLVILGVAVISFATKGMMLQATPSLTEMELNIPEIYRACEGLICVDAILALYCLLFMLLLCRPHEGVVTVFQILLVLILVSRFVLGIIFLAGNENSSIDAIKTYDDLTEEERVGISTDQRNIIVTLKGAWVFEVIAIILSVILSIGLIFMQQKVKHLALHQHGHEHHHENHHEPVPINS